MVAHVARQNSRTCQHISFGRRKTGSMIGSAVLARPRAVKLRSLRTCLRGDLCVIDRCWPLFKIWADTGGRPCVGGPRPSRRADALDERADHGPVFVIVQMEQWLEASKAAHQVIDRIEARRAKHRASRAFHNY